MTAAWRNATSSESADKHVARLREALAKMRFAPPDKPMTIGQSRAWRWCLAWMKRHGTVIPGSEKVLKGKA